MSRKIITTETDHGRKAMFRRSALAVADQAVLSIGGFVTAVVIAVYCSKEAFGIYALVQCALLLLGGLVGSALTQPMNVIGASLASKRFRGYAASLAVLQVGAGAGCAVLLGIVGLIAYCVGGSTELVSAILVAAVAVFFMQAREFTRQVLFTRLCPGRVLVNDVVYTGGVLALALGFGPLGPSAATALWWIASMAAVSMLIGIAQSAPLWFGGGLHLRRSWEANAGFGGWAAAMTLTSFGLCHLPLFVLPFLIGLQGEGGNALAGGLSAIAMIEVTRHLLAPLLSFRVAMSNVVIPRASILFAAEGRERMNGFLGRLAGFLTIGFAVYCLALIIQPTAPLAWLYGDKYAGAETFVRLWACVHLLSIASFVPVVGFGAMRRPDLLFKVSLLAAVCNIGLTFALVPVLGAIGVLLARAGGELIHVSGAFTVYTRAGIEKKPVVRFGT